MIYKITMEIPEMELMNIHNYSKIIQVYKDEPNDKEIEFIRKNFTSGIPCEIFYNAYCDHFVDDYIMRKQKFYEVVRQVTGAESRLKFESGEGTKYRFLVDF